MRAGHALSPDDVLITCGCTEALTLALRLSPSAAIRSRSNRPPTSRLLHTIEMLGLKAFELPTHPTRGIDVGAVARLLDTNLWRPVCCHRASTIHSARRWPSRQTCAPRGARAACRTAHRRRRLRRHSLRSRAAEAVHRARWRHQYDLLQLVFEIPRARIPRRVDCGGRLYAASYGAQARVRLCSPVLSQVALADFLESGAYDLHLRRIRRIFEENLARMTRTIEASFPPTRKSADQQAALSSGSNCQDASIRVRSSTWRSSKAFASHPATSFPRAGAFAIASV